MCVYSLLAYCRQQAQFLGLCSRLPLNQLCKNKHSPQLKYLKNRACKIVLKSFENLKKCAIICHFRKPKTQRGKRFLQDREPKIFENTKRCMFIKGGNTSQTVTQVLKELVSVINEVCVFLDKCLKLGCWMLENYALKPLYYSYLLQF